jgi:hypothetical protein
VKGAGVEHQSHAPGTLSRGRLPPPVGGGGEDGGGRCLRALASRPASWLARRLTGVVRDPPGDATQVTRWAWCSREQRPVGIKGPRSPAAPASRGLPLTNIYRQNLSASRRDCFKLNYSVACHDGLPSTGGRTTSGASSESQWSGACVTVSAQVAAALPRLAAEATDAAHGTALFTPSFDARRRHVPSRNPSSSLTGGPIPRASPASAR